MDLEVLAHSDSYTPLFKKGGGVGGVRDIERERENLYIYVLFHRSIFSSPIKYIINEIPVYFLQ